MNRAWQGYGPAASPTRAEALQEVVVGVAVLRRRLGPAVVAERVGLAVGGLDRLAAHVRQGAAAPAGRRDHLAVVAASLLAAGEVGVVFQELLKLLLRHLRVLEDVRVHL